MTCPGCNGPVSINSHTGRPKTFCMEACRRKFSRTKYRAAPVSDDCCPRCGMPSTGSGRVCCSCSVAINKRVASWLEDQPMPLPTGAVLELAGELGVSGYALTQRISRIRRGLCAAGVPR